MKGRLLMAAFLWWTLPAFAGNIRVEIFTDQDHPIANRDAVPGATVYWVDRPAQLLEGASKGLPPDADAASEAAVRRLRAMDMDALNNAVQGLLLAALQYRLDRYPAMVLA